MKSAALRIRIDPELHDNFLNSCKELDLSASHILRQFMKEFVEKSERKTPKELVEIIDDVVNNQI